MGSTGFRTRARAPHNEGRKKSSARVRQAPVTRRPFFNVEFLDSCHLAKTSHADGPTSRQIRLIFRARKWPDALLAHYGSELSTWILHAITREERKVLETLGFLFACHVFATFPFVGRDTMELMISIR